ncbi:MAG: acyl-CoA thioesterase [bacterium]
MTRRIKTDYFSAKEGDPPPLTAEIGRKARFEEVDALGIVWHGRYPSYLEDGRVAFGEKYGMRYLDMHAAGFIAPIVQMHIDYHHPLQLDDCFTIKACMHWSDSVRMNSSYVLTGPEDRTIATAYTVQLLMNLDREMLLAWPEFMEAFREKWKAGLLH